jgi:hypothetical protein
MLTCAAGGRGGAGAALLALCCLLTVLPAAADPVNYGAQFVRVGRHWQDAGELTAAQVASGRGAGEPEVASAFDRRLSALERQRGPYADALVEPLAGLGRFYRGSGDPAQAQRLYRRALHVVRVNDGLHSDRQLPILRELLASSREAGDLQALDSYYDYFFRLHGSGRPPYTEARLLGILEYLRWQREALRLELDGRDLQRLVRLYELNEQLLEAVAGEAALDHSWYRELTYSQVRNLYLVEGRAAPPLESRDLLPASYWFGAEPTEQQTQQSRLEVIQRGALSHGAALLQEVVDRSAAADPKELARAQLELGDWYQWHRSGERAGEHYAAAVRTLREAQQTALLERWLGQPVELPDNGAFWQPRPAPPGGRSVIVTASYDVSTSGRASNIEATAADAAEQGAAARLSRDLARIRFRPRWLAGRPEPVARLVRDYQLIN